MLHYDLRRAQPLSSTQSFLEIARSHSLHPPPPNKGQSGPWDSLYLVNLRLKFLHCTKAQPLEGLWDMGWQLCWAWGSFLQAIGPRGPQPELVTHSHFHAPREPG